MTTQELKYAILPETTDASRGKYGLLWGDARNANLSDQRSLGMTDHDKILYCHAWRRLAGVTQIISPDQEDIVLHTRLTHSEKVAQLSRSIALSLINRADRSNATLIAKLGGLDVHMAQAAGLAHDLGHPPFGHIAEDVLDQVSRVHGMEDGFEGNAQSLRTLVQIARWDQRSTRRGLRMTRGTYAAVLKYPWFREQLPETPTPLEEHRWKKFGAYDSERLWFEKARSWVPLGDTVPTLEASIMDLADEITYGVHDLFDFVGYGLIDLRDSLDRFRNGWKVFSDHEAQQLAALHPGYFGADDLEEAYEWLSGQVEIVNRFIPVTWAPAIPERAAARISSDLLDYFIGGTSVSEQPFWLDGPHLSLERKQFHNLYVLKEFTLKEALRIPDVAAQQRAARPLVRTILEAMFDWAENEPDSLPTDLRIRLLAADRGDDAISARIKALPGARQENDTDVARLGYPARLITDYIAGLTDHAARSLYKLIEPPGVEPIGRRVSL